MDMITAGGRVNVKAVLKRSVTRDDIINASKILIRDYTRPTSEHSSELLFKDLTDLKIKDATANLDLLLKLTQPLIQEPRPS